VGSLLSVGYTGLVRVSSCFMFYEKSRKIIYSTTMYESLPK